MKPVFHRTRAHLLACTGASCRARGADLVFRALWNGLERENLAYYSRGGNLRLTESGCLGACHFGPTLACYRRLEDGRMDEAWYATVDPALALRVARALHAGEDPPNERRYDG